MRNKIYGFIDSGAGKSYYDYIMMASIIISLIPLAFKQQAKLFSVIDIITVSIFIIDYALRWTTADYSCNKGAVSFVIYPFRPMAIIDLLSILPSFNVVSSGFRMFKLLRLFRTFRVFRAFKIIRYSKNIRIISTVIKKERGPLFAVATMAVGYIVISALIVFNVEPETFDNFFQAIYWAAVSLTTVGYGDIYPVTPAGQVVTIVSSFIGVAVVALPSGIITAGYMEEIKADK